MLKYSAEHRLGNAGLYIKFVSLVRCVFLCFTVQRRFWINLIFVLNYLYFAYSYGSTVQDCGQLQSSSVITL